MGLRFQLSVVLFTLFGSLRHASCLCNLENSLFLRMTDTIELYVNFEYGMVAIINCLMYVQFDRSHMEKTYRVDRAVMSPKKNETITNERRLLFFHTLNLLG